MCGSRSDRVKHLLARLFPQPVPTGFFIPLDHPAVVQPRPPGFTYPAVARRLEQDAAATAGFLASLAPFVNDTVMQDIRPEATTATAPYWNNGYFAGDDARLAYACLATGKPRLVIEIGSGHSTRFLRKAIATHGHATRIISIDPAPRSDISAVVDETIASSVLDVNLAVFDQLEAGDVLFWDGSHLVFNGTDTVRLFIEILPALKPGVVIHIHDICLPNEYTADFDGRGYNEQYLLAATLLFSDAWEVLAPVHHLCATGRLSHGGVSFWMRRRG